ncbi:MAG: ImmA/IrrE family metallo-endopeptidase [Clostridia bacterium]|nr:ImmA/IrrE family metallo-endopeptidase [Clostridia bacterium]
MNKIANRLAFETRKQNKLYSTLTYENLQHIIEEKGFQVVPYKKYNNSKDISACIAKLNLENEIQQHDSFLYLNNNLKLVFINSDLPTKDKCILLCHELGHIVDPALLTSALSHSTIQREEFANQFSFYLQNPSYFVRLLSFFSLKPVTITILTIFLFLVVGFGLHITHTYLHIPTLQIETTEYYVTPSGDKYHNHFCVIVKNRNNVSAYPLNELIENGYEPCRLCIGE